MRDTATPSQFHGGKRGTEVVKLLDDEDSPQIEDVTNKFNQA